MMWLIWFCLSLPLGIVAQNEATPVDVTIFIQSLCPGSALFLSQQMAPTYENLGSNLINIDIITYGLANETFREEDGGYDFGHFNGPDEGYGNKVINCGKEHLTDRDLYLKFVFCVMGADYPPFAGKKCAENLAIPYEAIELCANSTEGEILLHQAGELQEEMVPSIHHIPWLLVNEEHIQIDYEDMAFFKDLICSFFEDEEKCF